MVSMFKIKKFKRMGEYPRISEDYYRYRQENPELFDPKTFRTVPASHLSEFKKKKTFKGFDIHKLKGITGKIKTTGKWATQSILIPKKLIGK